MDSKGKHWNVPNKQTVSIARYTYHKNQIPLLNINLWIFFKSCQKVKVSSKRNNNCCSKVRNHVQSCINTTAWPPFPCFIFASCWSPKTSPYHKVVFLLTPSYIFIMSASPCRYISLFMARFGARITESACAGQAQSVCAAVVLQIIICKNSSIIQVLPI